MTEITVRGSFSAFRPPDLATVYATIAYEGPAMEPVYTQVARDLETVKTSIAPLAEADGAVTWWSADQLHTWSDRPWNQDGLQLPLVHHVSVGLKAEFADFTALSAWVGGHVADTEGFRMARVGWSLTTAHREDLLLEVRTGAVQDAVTRAQQYADALGLGAIRPVAVADAGMLPGTSSYQGGSPLRAMAAPMGGGAPDVELMPQDIEVSVNVDARFIAGR